LSNAGEYELRVDEVAHGRQIGIDGARKRSGRILGFWARFLIMEHQI
jgi:hypothetical protein